MTVKVQAAQVGEDGFLAGLDRCGQAFRIEHGLVIVDVETVLGPLSRQSVPSGVERAELSAWPSVPPHWIHFPGSVRFVHTNSKPSSVPGWQKHSRSVARWGNAKEPAQAWLAHVRKVLEDAS